ncbi:MAG: TolC family protein [Muribaculaceae bacterium]
MSYAIDHNIDVSTRRLETLSGELDVTAAKDRFLPQLSGYASQSFNLGRALTADNTYANRNTSSFSVGAQLSLPIFQGLSAVRRLDYARSGLRAMVEQFEAAKDDVTLNVISQYLQALYSGEMLQVAKERLAISRGELQRRSALLESGKIPELDIYQARQQVASDELTVVNATNDSIMALLDLAQLLNLPSADGFSISPLADTQLPLVSADDVFRNALQYNHSMRASALEVESAEKNTALAKTGYIPTLSFNAGLGTNYYKTSGIDNENFGQQMRHNFSQSFGFSLSVPIFDAFGTRNSVRRARLQEENARLRLDDSRARLFKAINQAYTQAVGADKKRRAADVAVEASRAAFEAMKQKYDFGRANATEFEEAKSNYTAAMAEAVQAKYESILRTRILQFYNKSDI